jgi:hypothetical protein
MSKIKSIIGIIALVLGIILSIIGGIFLGFLLWAAIEIYGPVDAYIRAYFGAFMSFIIIVVIGLVLVIIGIIFLILHRRSN